jgi:cupin 2 domain-containing protein
MSLNIFTLPWSVKLSEEEKIILLSDPRFRVERIVSKGFSDPDDFWYDQPEDEWVVVLLGEGEIGFADGTSKRLLKGDTCFIPARQRHRVTYTSTDPECIWLALYLSNEI